MSGDPSRMGGPNDPVRIVNWDDIPYLDYIHQRMALPGLWCTFHTDPDAGHIVDHDYHYIDLFDVSAIFTHDYFQDIYLISDTLDTPYLNIASNYFQITRIMVRTGSGYGFARIRIAHDNGGQHADIYAAFAAGDYFEIMADVFTLENAIPFTVNCPPIPVGSKVWATPAADTSTGTQVIFMAYEIIELEIS